MFNKLAVLALFFMPCFANEAFVAGVVNYPIASVNSSFEVGSFDNIMYGGGIGMTMLAGGKGVSSFGLEWNLLGQMRGYTKGGSLTSIYGVSLPVIGRFFFVPWLSVGLGASVTMARDAIEFAYEDSYWDVGLVGSIRLSTIITKAMSIIVDLRYQWGLVELAIGADKVTLRDASVLVGLGYQF